MEKGEKENDWHGNEKKINKEEGGKARKARGDNAINQVLFTKVQKRKSKVQRDDYKLQSQKYMCIYFEHDQRWRQKQNHVPFPTLNNVRVQKKKLVCLVKLKTVSLSCQLLVHRSYHFSGLWSTHIDRSSNSIFLKRKKLVLVFHPHPYVWYVNSIKVD